jgi:2-keto-4-pentenoate hydratase
MSSKHSILTSSDKAPVTPDMARDILVAFSSGCRVPQRHSPSDALEAYRVQAAVAAERGRVAGFKTARKPGEPQIMAPIMASDLVANGTRVASQFGGALGVELELGLRILAPLPAHDDPEFIDALKSCVEPLAVIELVDTRLEDPAADSLTKLADAQINAGLVIGPVLAGWNGGELAQVDAQMRFGTTVLLDGRAKVPGGDARETLHALSILIGTHCGGLQPGQIIITGSLHPLTYVEPGSVVSGWIDGCGAVTVEII